MASLVAQTVKCLPAMQETWVWSQGQKDPLEKEMATHSSTLAWKIPWMEEPGRLQSMGSQRVWHDWATSLLLVEINAVDSLFQYNHAYLFMYHLLLISCYSSRGKKEFTTYTPKLFTIRPFTENFANPWAKPSNAMQFPPCSLQYCLSPELPCHQSSHLELPCSGHPSHKENHM